MDSCPFAFTSGNRAVTNGEVVNCQIGSFTRIVSTVFTFLHVFCQQKFIDSVLLPTMNQNDMREDE